MVGTIGTSWEGRFPELVSCDYVDKFGTREIIELNADGDKRITYASMERGIISEMRIPKNPQTFYIDLKEISSRYR